MLKTETLLRLICDMAGVTIEQLKSRNRGRTLVMARYVFYHYARLYLNMTYKDIGDVFGNDHSTVLHGISMIKDMIEIEDEAYMSLLRAVSNEIRDKYQQEIKLSVFAPYDVNLGKLIETLQVEYRCRVIRSNSKQ